MILAPSHNSWVIGRDSGHGAREYLSALGVAFISLRDNLDLGLH